MVGTPDDTKSYITVCHDGTVAVITYICESDLARGVARRNRDGKGQHTITKWRIKEVVFDMEIVALQEHENEKRRKRNTQYYY